MRKIFWILIIGLIISVQNFCSAVQIETAHFNDNENLIYPVVSVGDVAIDRKINVAIIAEIDRFITAVYRNAQVNNFEVADVRTNYEIMCNGAGNTVILSVAITESSYYAKAAHPSTYVHTLNFNTSSGELMGKDYLLEVGEGLRDGYLIDKLNQKLREKSERGDIFLFENALPIKELPPDFYWDEKLRVHFIFQRYEIAPYAAGIIDVAIDD